MSRSSASCSSHAFGPYGLTLPPSICFLPCHHHLHHPLLWFFLTDESSCCHRLPLLLSVSVCLVEVWCQQWCCRVAEDRRGTITYFTSASVFDTVSQMRSCISYSEKSLLIEPSAEEVVIVIYHCIHEGKFCVMCME